MVRAASLSQQPDGIRAEPPANGVDPIGALLEVRTNIGRIDLSFFPALEEDTEEHLDAGQQIGVNNQDAAPRLAEVGLVGNGGGAAANEQLLEMEEKDLQAFRIILPKQPMRNSVITGRHCWLGLKELRNILHKQGYHKVPHGREFARLLERVARSMLTPSRQEYESVHCGHRDFPLDYQGLFNVVEGMTPHFSCPLDHGKCLDRLLEDMTATATLMRGGDGVYVSKDREQYARRLRSLAAHVLRYV